MEVIAEKNGDREKVTVSKTLEVIKKNYSSKKEKDSIIGEALGDEEDKFPGDIIYKKPSSKITKDIVVIVDSNLNVSGYVEEPDEDENIPKEDIPESEYTATEDVYYYEPDLSKFNPEATYYVTYDENGQNETIYGRIDRVEKPSTGWHNYGKKLWANVVTVANNTATYWTWIPRYKYEIEGNNSKAYFVDLNNNCKMKTDGIDQIIDVSSCELPESFKFGGKDLKGYWVSKYEIQFSDTSGLEQLKTWVKGADLEIGTTKPSGLYTIYVNGIKKIEHQNLDTPYVMKGLKSSKIYDICVYSETNSRMVGSEKKMVKDVIKVDTSGFEKSKTYYVIYDQNGKENIAGRMDKISEPIGWYDYQNKIWANVVTVNGNDVTYWTYIPRYEYQVDGLYTDLTKYLNVKFIDVTQTTADNEYFIPESFKFNGQELPGYWVSKYEIQLNETSGIEQIKGQKNGLEDQITTTNPSGSYTIYINGEKKETGIMLPYTLSNIKDKSDYEICLYSEEENRMIGSRKKSEILKEITKNVIEVDASGFNPDCTYYVTYDENGGNEQIGDKIQLDSKGNLINMPENWYDYENKRWANIVTKGTDASGNELISYWTYIPKYEYDLDDLYPTISGKPVVKFIPKTQMTADKGFVIPESFKFAGKDLSGYWVSKYEIQGTID